jgi:hypothetical protein
MNVEIGCGRAIPFLGKFVSNFRYCVFADLNELLDSHEAFFQGIKGGGVEHLLLDLGRVRTPGHQEQLLLLAGLWGALALVGVLKIEHAVPANRKQSSEINQIIGYTVQSSENRRIYIVQRIDIIG